MTKRAAEKKKNRTRKTVCATFRAKVRVLSCLHHKQLLFGHRGPLRAWTAQANQRKYGFVYLRYRLWPMHPDHFLIESLELSAGRNESEHNCQLNGIEKRNCKWARYANKCNFVLLVVSLACGCFMSVISICNETFAECRSQSTHEATAYRNSDNTDVHLIDAFPCGTAISTKLDLIHLSPVLVFLLVFERGLQTVWFSAHLHRMGFCRWNSFKIRANAPQLQHALVLPYWISVVMLASRIVTAPDSAFY